MVTYRKHWYQCWTIIGTLGVGSFVLLRPAAFIIVPWILAVLCAAALLIREARASSDSACQGGADWRQISARAVLLGTTIVGTVSTAVISGSLAFTLVITAGLSSPWVVEGGLASIRERTRSQRTASVRGAPQADRPGLGISGSDAPGSTPPSSEGGPKVPSCSVGGTALRRFGNQELCHGWRRTFVALQRASSPDELIRVVTLRQSYLDEMERRNPSALQAWLSSGARAAGGPDRFLSDEPGSRPFHEP